MFATAINYNKQMGEAVLKWSLCNLICNCNHAQRLEHRPSLALPIFMH